MWKEKLSHYFWIPISIFGYNMRDYMVHSKISGQCGEKNSLKQNLMDFLCSTQ